MAVLPMYMGVILLGKAVKMTVDCAPHVYGGDPIDGNPYFVGKDVLPMYMGVIPIPKSSKWYIPWCSPCIWG